MPVTNTTKSSRGAANAPRLNVISAILCLVCFGLGVAVTLLRNNPWGIIVGAVLGTILAMSPKVAQQWERAVVLRLGRCMGLRGPGLFWIIPGIDQVSTWIDQRTITTSF